LIAALAAATLFLFNAILGVDKRRRRRRRKRRQTKSEEEEKEEEGVVSYVSYLVWNAETMSALLILEL
jgi:hypothetical protein